MQHSWALILQYFTIQISIVYFNTDPGIQILYRTDGGTFNLQRLHAKTKFTLALVRDLLYTDDCAIVAHSEQDLQQLADSSPPPPNDLG
jgi:hypothetical protein